MANNSQIEIRNARKAILQQLATLGEGMKQTLGKYDRKFLSVFSTITIKPYRRYQKNPYIGSTCAKDAACDIK